MPHRRLTQKDARRFALALPEAHEGAHMGHADLRVGNKVFASLPNDRRIVAIKTTPTDLDAMVRADPATFRDVWGGRWVGVSLDRVSAAMLRQLLADAWELTAPKNLKAAAPSKAGSRRPTRKPRVKDSPRSMSSKELRRRDR